MENYSFLADLMTSFRASSDLVQIVWLLSPIACVVSIVYAAHKFRQPLRTNGGQAKGGACTYSFDMPQLGMIDIHYDGPLENALEDIHKYGVSLSAGQDPTRITSEPEND